MADIEQLLRGYRDFRRKYFRDADSTDSLYTRLKMVGQSPKTLVIACSDSRVDPAILTQAAPGDIFVIRNVANLVPPFESGNNGFHGVSAALEFGVRNLKVEHIIVLGHSHCAGIEALVSDRVAADSDFLDDWISLAAPAKARALDNLDDWGEFAMQHQCEREAIVLSLDNLMSFPWIRERVAEGTLELHGWYFSLGDGRLQRFDSERKIFVAVETD